MAVDADVPARHRAAAGRRCCRCTCSNRGTEQLVRDCLEAPEHEFGVDADRARLRGRRRRPAGDGRHGGADAAGRRDATTADSRWCASGTRGSASRRGCRTTRTRCRRRGLAGRRSATCRLGERIEAATARVAACARRSPSSWATGSRRRRSRSAAIRSLATLPPRGAHPVGPADAYRLLCADGSRRAARSARRGARRRGGGAASSGSAVSVSRGSMRLTATRRATTGDGSDERPTMSDKRGQEEPRAGRSARRLRRATRASVSSARSSISSRSTPGKRPSDPLTRRRPVARVRGYAGAVLLGFGSVLFVLGVLRMLQNEFGPTFRGRWMSHAAVPVRVRRQPGRHRACAVSRIRRRRPLQQG